MSIIADEERINYQEVLTMTHGKLLSADVLKLLGYYCNNHFYYYVYHYHHY